MIWTLSLQFRNQELKRNLSRKIAFKNQKSTFVLITLQKSIRVLRQMLKLELIPFEIMHSNRNSTTLRGKQIWSGNSKTVNLWSEKYCRLDVQVEFPAAGPCWLEAVAGGGLAAYSEGLQPCDGSSQDQGVDIMSAWKRRQTGSTDSSQKSNV